MSIAHSELNQNSETTVVDSLAEPEVIGSKLPLYKNLPSNKVFSVNDFLHRRVLQYTYSAGGTVGTSTHSYASDFISNVAILNKLKYMNLLRGTFVLDFVMNTNSYATGQIIIASHMGPWSNMGVTTSATNQIYSCTAKDHVILDAGSANTATIKIPMHLQYPFANVSGTIDNSLSQMMFTIATLVPIISTQDGTNSPIYIQCYVSMEDTELTVPIINGANAVYTMSSGRRRAEIIDTERGWFSYPVSIAAAAGKALKDVPVIGPFSYATGMFLGAAADFAKFFGFSRPRTLADVPYAHDEDYTSYVGEIRCKNLTLDPLQEIPIDNSFLGDKGDNLSYENLITKKGLLLNIPWPNTSAQSTQLSLFPITPSFVPLIDTTNYSIALPPVSYVSQLFKLWTGTLVYDFEVPANRYCRGKLRIVWTAQQFVTTPTYSEISQNGLSVILDLTTSSKVTMRIPWAQQTPYYPLFMPGGTVSNYTNGSNGFIYIYVEEQLIVQATTFSLSILVYVRADKDIDFQIPDQDKIQRLYRVPYVSGFTGTPVQITATNVTPAPPNTGAGFQTPSQDTNYFVYTMESNANNPMLSTSHTILPDDDRQHPAMMNMGERFYSLRPILKRFYEYQESLNPVTQNVWWFFPYLPTEVLPVVSGGNVDVPNSIMTPVRYIANMFYGCRGSLRYRLNPTVSTSPSAFPFRPQVKRMFGKPYTFSSPTQLSNASANVESAQGEATYAFQVGESVIFDVPYQTVSNFLQTGLTNTTYSSTQYGFSVYDSQMSNTMIYSSIGDDWMPVIYNGPPIVSIYYIQV